MFTYLIVAAFLPSIILGYTVVPCGGGLPAPTAIRIANCPASPCNVDQGQSIDYEVDFVATEASPSLTLAIVSTVFGEERNIPIPEGLACATLTNASCPVAAGQQLTQAASLPADSEHHGGIPVQLRVTMTNAADVVNFCCLVNLVIF